MTAPKKTASNNAPTATKNGNDAIAMLKADHEAVSKLFAEYEKTRSAPDKKAIVEELCAALIVHAQIEEEIFYPAVKAALKDKLLVPEATVEHASVKDLMFPKAKGSSLDMNELGARMAARKDELMAQTA